MDRRPWTMDRNGCITAAYQANTGGLPPNQKVRPDLKSGRTS